MSIWGYGRERNGILGNLLNTHPMALKHLMPALMHFYIGMWFPKEKSRIANCANCCSLEVEQTGASSQFYDKFSTFSIYRPMILIPTIYCSTDAR